MHRLLPEPVSPLHQAKRLGWRTLARFALRLLARVALAAWFGGFTFYASVVVPELHERFGGMETGEISRKAAAVLYAIGASALSLGWVGVAADPIERSGWRGRVRIGLLAVGSILLGVLVAMHRVIGSRIDAGLDRDAFFPLHETYLTIFAVQWVGILGLMALDSAPVIPARLDGTDGSITGTG